MSVTVQLAMGNKQSIGSCQGWGYVCDFIELAMGNKQSVGSCQGWEEEEGAGEEEEDLNRRLRHAGQEKVCWCTAAVVQSSLTSSFSWFSQTLSKSLD